MLYTPEHSAPSPSARPLEDDVEKWDREHAEQSRRDHAAEHGRADAAPGERATPVAKTSGARPKTKARLVISTGRIRMRAPEIAASSTGAPRAC